MKRRTILGSIRSGATIGAARVAHLRQLEAIVGARGMDDALDVGIEAAKMGLRLEDLNAAVRTWHDMKMLGLIRPSGQGFVAWSIQHGFATERQYEAARRLDILGMGAEPDDPADHR